MLSVSLVIVCSFSQILVLRFSFPLQRRWSPMPSYKEFLCWFWPINRTYRLDSCTFSVVNCKNTHWTVATVWPQRWVKRTAYILTCMIYKILWNTKLEFIWNKTGSTFSHKRNLLKKMLSFNWVVNLINVKLIKRKWIVFGRDDKWIRDCRLIVLVRE